MVYFVATYAPIDGDDSDFNGEITTLIDAPDFSSATVKALEHEPKFQAFGFRLENLLLDCD